ncbi:uncharacterized protein BHQ10_008394 [Talaromyces amestolkiae]|uniref:Methyltransferase domain-containing protein n=1 Tax=Talaromyces amestolkiae TaxID=1196081 RepID=A0A364L991_TALAM|nr:uncharacterized protein BHQ10_008394 [Talaromyces amestolkiae]RAO72382.1 hypothetical protein BHQ10_008394 [Talaromyces amestolkiae]
MASDLVDRPRYVFDRNHQGASVRLNYQHFLITTLTDNQLLHQATQDRIDLSTPHRVADIGTGTAIWPMQLAQKLPHWQIDGFDISGDQYPSATWVSPNITIHEHDAFQPLLSEYHGKYDIVNLRFFITLLNGQILNQLLQNIMALLKPGGLFQWLDIDAPSVKPIGLEPASMTRTSLVATMMKNTPPDAALWITPNCDMATSARFEAIAYDQLRLNDLHRPIWNQCVTMGLEEVIAGLEKRESGAESARAQEMRDILDHLSKEFRQGVSIDTPWFYLVVRKPL